jgi:hypothetical protein
MSGEIILNMPYTELHICKTPYPDNDNKVNLYSYGTIWKCECGQHYIKNSDSPWFASWERISEKEVNKRLKRFKKQMEKEAKNG